MYGPKGGPDSHSTRLVVETNNQTKALKDSDITMSKQPHMPSELSMDKSANDLNYSLENYKEMKSELQFLTEYRSMKTACHELCHVLGMTHCPYYECLMNGSNLVNEADKKPFLLCPICLRKLEAYLNLSGQIPKHFKNMLGGIKDTGNPMFARERNILTSIINDLEDHEIIERSKEPKKPTSMTKEKLIEVGTQRQKPKMTFRQCLCPQFLIGIFDPTRGQRANETNINSTPHSKQ